MITGATGVTGTYSTTTASSTGGSDALGRDAFLKLLLVKLQNQDPLNPTEDKEFLAQLAQFSSLEAMEKMSGSLEALMNRQSIMGAASLIGKTVTAYDSNAGQVVTGKVEKVTIWNGEPMLRINGSDISINYMQSVE